MPSFTSNPTTRQTPESKEPLAGDGARRAFQRVKTVSFANLENADPERSAATRSFEDVPFEVFSQRNVASQSPCQSQARTPSLGGVGASTMGGAFCRGVSLDSGGSSRRSEAQIQPAYPHTQPSIGSFQRIRSLRSMSGSTLQTSADAGCCGRVRAFFVRIGLLRCFRSLQPERDLAFHTKEEMQQHTRSGVGARSQSPSCQNSSLGGGCGGLSGNNNTCPQSSVSPRGRPRHSSSCAEELLFHVPLRFANYELELLFALNVNVWIGVRLLPLALLLLLLTLGMWPLMAWSFDQQRTFEHTSSLGIMFNVAMAVTVVTAVVFAVVSKCRRFRPFSEAAAYFGMFLIVTMWGIWNAIASHRLESAFDGSDEFRSTEESMALEACTAMSYVYGVLPLVILDVVFPSRTRYTWIIHLSFFATSSASIAIRGALNSRFIAPSFVVIRVLTYFILALFLYLGRHAAEVQLRQTFVGWLKTRRRVDRLESDLQRQRAGGGAATSVEQLVFLLRKLQDSYQSAAAGVAVDKPEEVALQVAESQALVDQCLSILCAASSLYAVTFTPGDEQQHQDIIRAFLNDRNSSTAEWNDVRVSAASPSSSKPAVPESASAEADESAPSSSSPTAAPPPLPPPRDRSWIDGGNEALLSAAPAANSPLFRFSHQQTRREILADRQEGAASVLLQQPSTEQHYAASSQSQRHQQELFFAKQQSQQPHHSPQQQQPHHSHSQQQQQLVQVGKDGGTGDAAEPSVDFCTSTVGQGPEAGIRGAESPEQLPSPKQRVSGFTSSPVSLTAAASTKTGVSGSVSAVPKKPLDGFKLQQLYVLPFPKGRRGSESDAEGVMEDTALQQQQQQQQQPHQQQPVQGGGDYASNRSSLLSDLIPRARRGSRFNDRGTVGAVEEKLLKVAMLFSPLQAGGSSPSGCLNICDWRFDCLAAGRLSAQPLTDVGFLMLAPLCIEMSASLAVVASPVPSPPHGGSLTEVAANALAAASTNWSSAPTSSNAAYTGSPSPTPPPPPSNLNSTNAPFNSTLPTDRIEVCVKRFLRAVESKYCLVPYHNSVHGLMVAQKTYALLHLTSLAKSRDARDLVLIVVAGLCHDMGHPGRNNSLFTNALDPVAVLYNDRAVLENYHSCLTFKVLEKPECDIFAGLKTRDYLWVRSQIIELILATDMKGHFETVSRFRVRRSAPDFDPLKEEDFWFLAKMFIKAADVSHCGVDWSQHFDWCQRVLSEFYDQGDEEVLRRLPVSPLCDRRKHAEAAKGQMGFIEFVAQPLFEEIAAADFGGLIGREVLTQVKENAFRWKALSSCGVCIPQFLEPWPVHLLHPRVFDEFELATTASAAVQAAAAANAENASALNGSKVHAVNERFRETKLLATPVVSRLDLRPLFAPSDSKRHRRSSQLLLQQDALQQHLAAATAASVNGSSTQPHQLQQSNASSAIPSEGARLSSLVPSLCPSPSEPAGDAPAFSS